MAASPTSSILTVAVPTCNGARHLGEALRSILAQEGSRSSSSSPTIDQTTTRSKWFAPSPAIECASRSTASGSAWRETGTGARRSRARPLVAIFHQDDVMLPGHLQAHAAALDIGPIGRPGRQCRPRHRRAQPAGLAQHCEPGRARPAGQDVHPRRTGRADGLRQPLALFGRDDARRRAPRSRRLRSIVSLRGGLGFLAACLAEMEGRLARETDGPDSLALRQRDPSLRGRHRRPRRDFAASGAAFRDRLERSAGCRRNETHGEHSPRPGLLESGFRRASRRSSGIRSRCPASRPDPISRDHRHNPPRPSPLRPDGGAGRRTPTRGKALRPARGRSIVVF